MGSEGAARISGVLPLTSVRPSYVKNNVPKVLVPLPVLGLQSLSYFRFQFYFRFQS